MKLSCSHSHSFGVGSNHKGETTPLIQSSYRPRDSSVLFVEPDAEDPLTAQKLHQVAHDIHEYGVIKERLNWFLIYIMAILLYMGLNGALLFANTYSQDYIEDHYELPMHFLSFWGVFWFTVVEAVLLIATGVVNWDNKGTSAVILFDVCMSFFSATLYTMDPETFEVPSHYIEYIVQIPITCVNLIFVGGRSSMPSFVEDDENKSSVGLRVWRMLSTGSSYAVLVLSVLQLVLYSSLVSVRMGPERSAHMCEFTNEIVNGLFALEYAIVCFNEWKQQLDQHTI